MKLGEVVVPMDTTTSPSFIKIGLKTKKFSHEPISGTARPRLVRMTGPEKNRTNQKRTIYLLKPKITLKSAKTRAK